MFNWFCKKTALELPVEPKFAQRTTKLVYEEQLIDIGRTKVIVYFADGQSFGTWRYGIFYINCGEGADETNYNLVMEPSVIPHSKSSLQLAQAMLMNISADVSSTVLNDPENPTNSRSGKIVAAEILKSEPYLKMIEVGKIVPK